MVRKRNGLWPLSRVATLLAAAMALGTPAACTPDCRGTGNGTAGETALLDGHPRQILPGVWALGEFFPVSLYLLEATDGLVLVDTGFAGEREAVLRAIRSLGRDPARIRHILITHLHLDHAMGIEGLRRAAPGAMVYAGAADAELLAAGPSWDLTYPGRIPPPGWSFPPVHVDRPIQADQDLDIPGLQVRALLTPGHTPGSTCFLVRKDGKAILLSGDTVMSVASEDGTYTAGLAPPYGGDAQAYLASVARLRGLDVDVLLPGHPYFDRRDHHRSPSPFLPKDAWQTHLERTQTELQTILARFQADGRDWLDGRPRSLHPGLFYLGEPGPCSAWALEGPDGLALVDPGPAGGTPALWRALLDLGYAEQDVKAVLVTGAEPARAGAVPEVLALTGAALYGHAEALAALPAAPDGQALKGGERLRAAGLELWAVSTPAAVPGSMSYLVDLGGRLAAFTGTAVRPRTADGPAVPQDRGAPDPEVARAALEGLADHPVQLWLPARPFAMQNANLYDDEWAQTIEANLRDAVPARTR